MTIDLSFIVVIAATSITGLLAGASLDKAIVQLPARHRMGVIGFAEFSRANDLGNGLLFYPALGISATLLTIIAAISAFLFGTTVVYEWPLYISALLALFHTVATIRAAPLMLSLRQPMFDEAILTETFNRFTMWHNFRAILQLLNFIMLIWATVSYTLVIR